VRDIKLAEKLAEENEKKRLQAVKAAKELAERQAKEKERAIKAAKDEAARLKREEELACRVCYEQPNTKAQSTLSGCKHKFHTECLKDYLRSEIKTYKRHEIACLKCKEENKNTFIRLTDVLGLVPEMSGMFLTNLHG